MENYNKFDTKYLMRKFQELYDVNFRYIYDGY